MRRLDAIELLPSSTGTVPADPRGVDALGAVRLSQSMQSGRAAGT